MAEFSFLIFAANNLTNPQNPGFLPAEDNTFLSDLVNGDQITWNGGGESVSVTVNDPTDTSFNEAQSNQTLVNPVTFDGVSYSAGQVVTPSYTINFSGSDGNTYTMTSFNFSPNSANQIADAVMWEGNIPPSGTVLTVTSESNPAFGNSPSFEDFVTCFCIGTLIDTDQGMIPVELLKTGCKVVTQDGDLEEVIMVCSRHITAPEMQKSPKLRPVVISKGALGQNLPTRDLRVSRQHRFKVSSPICKRMFGEDHVLVAAINLTEIPGIYIDHEVSEVSYYHILLEKHEILFAEGALAESLYLGKHALHAMTLEAREEVKSIFPDLFKNGSVPEPAFFVPKGKQQKKLVSRHVKNSKPLLM